MAECLHVAGMFFPNKTDVCMYVALLESKTDPLGGLIHTAHKKVVHFFSVLL